MLFLLSLFSMNCIYTDNYAETRGAFHLTKNAVWISGNFQWRIKQHFSKFREKEANLARYAKSFKDFLPGISVPADFPGGFFGIFD